MKGSREMKTKRTSAELRETVRRIQERQARGERMGAACRAEGMRDSQYYKLKSSRPEYFQDQGPTIKVYGDEPTTRKPYTKKAIPQSDTCVVIVTKTANLKNVLRDLA